MKVFFLSLFIIFNSYSSNLFEFNYGLSSGDFYVQDKETKNDDTLEAQINHVGFNYEQFFTENQKFIISLQSKSISYSNSAAEFSDNDITETVSKLAWAYASGNFQFDLGIMQNEFYYFEIQGGNYVKFYSDRVISPYLNLQYVFNFFDYGFLGLEALYQPSYDSNDNNKVNLRNYRFNFFKQFTSVRLGAYFFTRSLNIDTNDLVIKRNSTGYGLDLIFLF